MELQPELLFVPVLLNNSKPRFMRDYYEISYAATNGSSYVRLECHELHSKDDAVTLLIVAIECWRLRK